MIVRRMLEELAKEIAQSRNRHKIISEIEWYLQGHYTKNRFLALLMVNGICKSENMKEYIKISEELENKELLLELYKLIKKQS
jgi:hypothetical protein